MSPRLYCYIPLNTNIKKDKIIAFVPHMYIYIEREKNRRYTPFSLAIEDSIGLNNFNERRRISLNLYWQCWKLSESVIKSLKLQDRTFCQGTA